MYRLPIAKDQNIWLQWLLGHWHEHFQFGAKVTYTDNIDKDFILPTLALGMLRDRFWRLQHLAFLSDVNKLLVPSPWSIENPKWDANKNNIADWRERPCFKEYLDHLVMHSRLFWRVKEFYYSIGRVCVQQTICSPIRLLLWKCT